MLRNFGTLVLLVLLATPLAAVAQTGTLAGRVTDDLGDPLPGANVVIEGTQLGTATDLDGNYRIIGIPVGEYDVTASFVGYGEQTIEGVQISSGYTTQQEFTLAQGEELGEIVIEYERPIIQRDAIGVPKVVTGEQIQNLPVRGVASVAAIQSGVVANEGSDDLFVRGGREQEVAYYVDGVKVTTGRVGVNQQAIAEQEMLIGTIPARYGDAMSGIISITTKSGGTDFFGSAELITSEVLDDYGYNLASLSVGGPILPGKASFFASVSGSRVEDSSPYTESTLRLRDDVFNSLLQNPQVFEVVNGSGDQQFIPIPTEFGDGSLAGANVADVLADPAAYGIQIPEGYELVSGFPIDAPETFTREQFEAIDSKDDDFWDVTFNGNVTVNPTAAISLRLGGQYDRRQDENYNYDRSFYVRDRFYNVDQDTWRVYGTFRQRLTDASFYQVQVEYTDYKLFQHPNVYSNDVEDLIRYGDVTDPANIVAARYVTLESATLPTGESVLRYVRRQDGAFAPGTVYNAFDLPGTPISFYRKRHDNQLRVSGRATAQVGLHQIEFGAEYEQQTRRRFELIASRLARYVADPDDPVSPGAEALGGDAGFSSYEELPKAAFGDDANFYLYYGYNYNGTEEVDGENIGNYIGTDPNDPANVGQFNIAPYEPIYYAGYIQDKIEYRDLVINLGLRVDVFDNNTSVLRDIYAPYPIIRAGDLNNSELLGEFDVELPGDFSLPGGVESDYAVYFNNAGTLVGFRDLEGDFFDAEGRPVESDDVLNNLAGSPIRTGSELSPEAFTDYDPEVTFMPRIGVSFPVTDRALFFASYNVTSQRPSENAFVPFNYYVGLTGQDRIDNSNLRPEKTTQYELGFRQRVGERAAFTLSGFYRTQENKVQVRELRVADPVYSTFLNADFTTTKGVEVEFDLRRTNNLSLNANYTYAFALGTGSDASSTGVIAWRGGYVPDILSPADFDRRHTANVTLDYRFGEAEGPMLFGARPFENFGINVLYNFKSGQPYTLLAGPGPFYSGTRLTEIKGGSNETYLPASNLINVRIDRTFNVFGRASIKPYLWIQNLLNTENILSVYRATGDPDNDGFLESPGGITDIVDNPTLTNTDSAIFHYEQFTEGPVTPSGAGRFYVARPAGDLQGRFFGLPRQVRLGVLIDF